MAEEVLAAAQDPGTAYRANFGNGSNEGSFATAATTALSPLTFAASVVGLATWSRHSWPVRVLLLGELCLQGASALVRGQNLGFFKIAVVVVAVLVVRYAGPAAEPRKRRQIAAVVMGIVTAAITYFAVNTSDRFSSDLPAVVGGVPIDYDAGVMHLVPDGLQLPVVLLFSYLSQGYHGLRQAITMPFHSTWGMGSSRFLMQNLEGMLGIEVEGRTYIHRMDSVWEESNRWHTAYTWFANDVSPWGVVVVMVAIGWLTGRVLTCALRGELVGVVLLPLVILGVVFLPANTLVLSNPLTCMPLLVWGALFVTGQVATSQSWARSRCGSLLTEATPIGAASVRRHYAWRRGMSR